MVEMIHKGYPSEAGHNPSTTFADLLHGSQALELGGAEAVLLLERGGLQHQMLLLSGIHLL